MRTFETLLHNSTRNKATRPVLRLLRATRSTITSGRRYQGLLGGFVFTSESYGTPATETGAQSRRFGIFSAVSFESSRPSVANAIVPGAFLPHSVCSVNDGRIA